MAQFAEGDAPPSLWNELLAQSTSSDTTKIPSPVISLSSHSQPLAYKALAQSSINYSAPLQYGLVEDQLPAFQVDVGLDDRSLLSNVILKTSKDAPSLYVLDVIVSASCAGTGDEDVFTCVKSQVNAVCATLKEEASLPIPPITFPFPPAPPPPSSSPASLPVLLAVSIDTSLFEGTYVKKQAGAYLTYKLVSFAADTGEMEGWSEATAAAVNMHSSRIPHIDITNNPFRARAQVLVSSSFLPRKEKKRTSGEPRSAVSYYLPVV